MAQYPAPGCVVEYLEDNAAQIAIVMEESGGKLRLLLPNRKEVKLAANRILPWIGPCHGGNLSREEAVKILEQHRSARQGREMPVLELWEMAAGEVEQAPASWFAELMESAPDEDTIAAWGRALLQTRSHFRFQPPDFQVYDAETVEKRLAEQQAREEKEALASQGTRLIRCLYETAVHKQPLPANVSPPEPLAGRIRHMLMARVANPESREDEALWNLLSKGLPEFPWVPVQLLEAWGVLPEHYNFWLDRAEFAAGDDWWADLDPAPSTLGNHPPENRIDLPFISIDGPTTFDIDDAFHIEKTGDGYRVTLAFACPAREWPFGSPLDRAVAKRSTSIYLPEGDLHMLPAGLGLDKFSLLANNERPALCMTLEFGEDGEILACTPATATVRLAANLRYREVQTLLDGGEAPNALPFREQLRAAHELALKREKLRIGNGAVIMLRQDPHLELNNGEKGIEVEIVPEEPSRDAQRLVSEFMIAASGCIADWANERQIPLLHRTQNVALPKEYAGVWEKPEDLALIIRALIPSTLEVTPRPHSALGLSRYAQITSPLRRYSDLVNEAQIVSALATGEPIFDQQALEGLLDTILPALDAANQVQRNRPRYWKLLALKQRGDKIWHEAVITEESDNFITAMLPVENLQIRGRRAQFGDRTAPGTAILARLGRISPIANEIHILEVLPAD